MILDDSGLIFPAGKGMVARDGRLDISLCSLTGASRSWSKRAIKRGDVRVGNQVVKKPSQVVREGDELSWPALETPRRASPGHVPFDVLFENDTFAVIEKPWGVVCHQGAGTRGRTLAEGLIHRFGPLPGEEGRGGLVHRLDRGTHGLLVIARSEFALHSLQQAVRKREVKREYVALVLGDASKIPRILDASLSRHPKKRVRFTGRFGGRKARTHVDNVIVGEGFSRVMLHLDTGRTHQIRVHLSEAGFPVIGDALYGGRGARKKWEILHGGPLRWKGHALVAFRLSFADPITSSPLTFEATLPSLMERFPQ